MAHAQTRQHAHELIERMAPGQVPAAVELLEKMLDPVSLALANAPFEDEEISEEEERAVARAKAETGQSTSMEDLLTEYRLTPQERERMGQTPSDARGKNT
jgi:hypothetical protein